MNEVIYLGIKFSKPINDEPKKQDRCHRELKKSIKDNLIYPGPCEVCATNININGHHEDYNNPLIVRWLCHKHHMSVHALFRESKAQSRIKFIGKMQ